MTLLQVLEPMLLQEATGKGAGVINLWVKTMSQSHSNGEYWTASSTFYINAMRLHRILYDHESV